jgi:uncharacterized protein (DUF1015 family)
MSKYCIFDISSNVNNNNNVVIKLRNGQTYKVLFRPNIITETSLYFAIEEIIFQKSLGIVEREKRIYPLPGSVTLGDSDSIFNLYKDSSAIVFIPSLAVSEFFKIVDNGNKLPPTSTWFEPKIIDGFLMNNFG